MRRAASTQSAPASHEAYPVRMAAKLSGVSADLIRAWEKRYAAVKPVRGPRGARLYSQEDVNRLRALASAVASGRSIGDIVHMDDEALRRLAFVPARPPAPESSTNGDAPIVSSLLQALRAHDLTSIEMQLADSLIALGSRAFLQEVAVPALRMVGDAWARGELTIAQEHLFSGILRNLLTGMLRSRPITSGPCVLLATPPGERHEFGLLLCALVARNLGVAANYVGLDLPASEVIEAAERGACSVVAISTVAPANRSQAVAALRDLERNLPAAIELWIGGADAAPVHQLAGATRARLVLDLNRLEDEMERISKVHHQPLRVPRLGARE